MSKNNFEVNLGLLDNLFEIKYDFKKLGFTLFTGNNLNIRDAYIFSLLKQIESIRSKRIFEIKIIDYNQDIISNFNQLQFEFENRFKSKKHLIIFVKDLDLVYKKLESRGRKELLNFIDNVVTYGYATNFQVIISVSEITNNKLSKSLHAHIPSHFHFECNTELESKKLIYKKGLEKLGDEYFYFQCPRSLDCYKLKIIK